MVFFKIIINITVATAVDTLESSYDNIDAGNLIQLITDKLVLNCADLINVGASPPTIVQVSEATPTPEITIEEQVTTEAPPLITQTRPNQPRNH